MLEPVLSGWASVTRRKSHTEPHRVARGLGLRRMGLLGEVGPDIRDLAVGSLSGVRPAPAALFSVWRAGTGRIEFETDALIS